MSSDSNAEKWLDAAAKYDLNREREQEERRKEQERLEAIQDATDELTTFIATSNGEAAMKLLKASGRDVRFAEAEEDQGGIKMCWLLTATGLVVFVERKNTTCTSDEPTLEPSTPADVVQAWAKDGMKEPASLVPWLTAQLDEIADAAPSVV